MIGDVLYSAFVLLVLVHCCNSRPPRSTKGLCHLEVGERCDVSLKRPRVTPRTDTLQPPVSLLDSSRRSFHT